MMKILEQFNIFLKKKFRGLGKSIARHTGYFFVVPFMLSLICGTGFQRMKYVTDPEYLFSPSNGLAKSERSFIENNFYMNFSTSFDPSRITRPGRFVRVIISAKDDGSLIREGIWNEIMAFDSRVRATNIIFDEDLYTYHNVCAKWDGSCFENKILNLDELMPEILNGSFKIEYPVTLNPNNFDVYVISVYFGGITVEEDGTVSEIKGLILNYWLKSETKKDDEKSRLWELEVLTNSIAKEYKYIKVAKYSSKTLEDELDVNTKSVIPYLVVTVFIMVVFSITASCMTDWVRSKAYIGFLGIFSVMLACIMTFGIMMYVGIPFIGMNLAAPFLMLGIGIDDMFVMLAAWRRTRIQDSLEERLGETYAESGVAITITSLTDMFSFFIGIITPFPSVQIFCIYTGTAVFLTYLWQLTFFGACMAMGGRMEAKQKHALCCHTVKAKSVSENEGSYCDTIWCSGGINSQDKYNPKDNKPHTVMVFFRDVFAKCLNNPFVKGVVVISFMFYLAGAIYGFLEVKEGLERRRLSRYDSYSVEFYDMEDKYFREYPYRIQVILHDDINYSDLHTKQLILSLHEKLENLPYIAPKIYTESWIRGWYEFLDQNSQFINLNVSEEVGFISNLREYYLSGNDNVFKLDVKFNENFTRILASRFVIQTYRILDSNEEKEMMKNLREFANDFPLNMTVYHPLFVYFDQYVLVRTVSIKTIGIAAVIMLLVSLILIPNPWCSLWVGFSILSIEIGVVGYMTLWGVNLDSISMINLIMCIGFSVDFSAHISYAYFSAKAHTPEERVRESLYGLGLPILQGAISTVLGVSALTLAPSYIFVTFFKTVFLVVFFGALHGLLLLPVLLSILGPNSCDRFTSRRQIRDGENASGFQRNCLSSSNSNIAESISDNSSKTVVEDYSKTVKETNLSDGQCVQNIARNLNVNELDGVSRKGKLNLEQSIQSYKNNAFQDEEDIKNKS
ncbi:UNVERIFIED_CONTAM: hypothetical protein RMT77_017115 [Armadillidium vulgare]